MAAWLALGLGCSPKPSTTGASGDARERAYRANNVGVALLEQLKYPEAAAAFRDALAIDATLGIAHLNLSLALLYAQDYDGAQREAETAVTQLPDAPQAPYVLGLVARSQSRTDVARTQFERVRTLDPGDVGTAINLAQIALEDQRYADAVAVLRPVAEREPSNVTAAYVLGLALTRSGSTEDGRRYLEQAQALRRSGYAVTFGTGYLEQGPLAEAIASTGGEADQVMPLSRARLEPTLVSGSTAAPVSAVTAIDLDADGDIDAVTADERGVRAWRNDGRTWVDAGEVAGFAVAPEGAGDPPAAETPVAAVAGDVDGDGISDLLLARSNAMRLFRGDGQGHFTDVTTRAAFPAVRRVLATALVDVDHDGDLDVVAAGADGIWLCRNNRDGTFTDVTRASQLAAGDAVVAIVPTDFDNHRDVDLLLVSRGHGPTLYANQRDGSFRDVTAATGLSQVLEEGSEASGAASGDLNKDDAPDIVLATSRGLVAAISDGRGHFVRQVIAGERDLTSAQVFDYDNDGLLDVIGWGAGGPRLWRNEGPRWREVTSSAIGQGGSAAAAAASAPSSPAGPRSGRSLVAGDFDRDGDTDALVLTTSGLVLWTNSGDPDRHGLKVTLAGLVSNKPGVGAKVQLRAGSLSSRVEVAAASPAVAPADIVFGLGARTGADVVRVLWPSGIVQAEVGTTATANTNTANATTASTPAAPPLISAAIRIEELDRKPSSCPFLFTWNGERYEFVTDFLGGGEMGDWIAPGRFNRPDPVEYVRIQPDQLLARDGRFSLRITNELEETLFLDHVQLMVVAHPREVFVYPNEGMTDPPKPHRLHTVGAPHPPHAVRDEHGHDVTGLVAAQDWRAVDDFALEPIRGYARPHALTIDIGPARRPVLLLTAWTDYAFSSDNVAASQAGLLSEPPVLEARRPGGPWRRLNVDIGLPVGRPQTIAVDISSVLLPGEQELRLATNMRIYWDRIAIAEAIPALRHPETLAPVTADLRARGFSAELKGPGRAPLLYDYARVTERSPWKAMAGRFTREGDVRPLLGAADDQFVIARPGDEIALEFAADALTPLPEGWTRTYLLRADGFSKEMDPNSASPYTVEPLPFHRMTRYPYDPARERYPETAAHNAYRETWNTRPAVRPLPPLSTLSTLSTLPGAR